MSVNIQEALDLPILEDLLKTTTDAEPEPELTDEMAEQFDQDEKSTELAEQLNSGMVPEAVRDDRQVRDHEKSMDKIHDDTMQHAKDLMDLGYNVDTRSAKGIFDNAANMYKIAMDAKNSKRDAQLKLMKLKLEERRVELEERGGSGKEGDIVDGEAVVVTEDRNELIKQFLEMKNNNK